MRRAAAIVGATALSIPAPALLARQSPPATRTIHVSASDANEEPVLGLTAHDFIVKDSGRSLQISVRPATAPLRVALIVSDSGEGMFQVPATRFCEAIVDHGEIAITGLVWDLERLNDYTRNVDVLGASLLQLRRIGFINRPRAPRLIEAIVEVAKGIRRDGYRPAVVVMRTGGEALPAFDPDVALNALKQSGAVMYVVGPGAGAGSGMRGGEQRPFVSVFDDGTRQSGGRLVVVTPSRLESQVLQVASELINQYEITYTLPPGEASSGPISVTTMRTDVTVRAPSWVAR